jgi:signal transduction histidine kinase
VNLQKRPWWDAAVAATVVICAAAAWGDGTLSSSRGPWTALALVVFALLYACLGRWALGRSRPMLARTYLTALAIVVGAATTTDPSMATLQVVAYPLIGCLAAAVAEMLVWDVVLALAVFAGYALGVGDAVAGAIVTALSLAFAIVMGLWITRIAAWGDERAALLAEVQAAQQQASDAASETGAARERERIARDMHDTVAQSLTGIVMLVERAERQTPVDATAEPLRQTLGTLEDAAREALHEIRAVVAESAGSPVEHGLSDAVRRVVTRFERETGVRVRFDLGDLADVPLDRELEVVLLRCVQEALANVGKHADADLVEASLRCAEGMVVLTLADDGVGPGGDREVGARGAGTTCAPDGAPRVGTGFGLDGMRERVRPLGGEVRFGAAPAGGAVLAVRVPLHPANPDAGRLGTVSGGAA